MAIDVAIGGERAAEDRTVAEHCKWADGGYVVVMVRGMTKAEMAEQLSAALHGVDPDDIISITYHADWLWFFPLWRRNSALIVIKPG